MTARSVRRRVIASGLLQRPDGAVTIGTRPSLPHLTPAVVGPVLRAAALQPVRVLMRRPMDRHRSPRLRGRYPRAVIAGVECAV